MTTRFVNPTFGLDSMTAVGAPFHHAVHSRFAARYSGHYQPKVITLGEYEAYKREDIGLLSVFEDGAINAKQGYDQGKSDAEFAMKQTTAAGRPKGRPIFFAVDFPSSGSDVDSYFDGCAAVLTRDGCGPYGDYAVVGHLMDRGFEWAWQTYAWSAGRVDKRAQVLQYSNDHIVGGVGVDFDYAWYPDYGNWNYKPVIKDPNHYYRFQDSYVFEGRVLHERALAILYDHLIHHPKVNAKKLIQVKADLRECADHIYSVSSAHRRQGSTLPMEWSPWYRWWRYPQLIDRSKGKVVAV